MVHGDKELSEKLGRNDLCPCGSGYRFQAMLHAQRPFRWRAQGPLRTLTISSIDHGGGGVAPRLRNRQTTTAAEAIATTTTARMSSTSVRLTSTSWLVLKFVGAKEIASVGEGDGEGSEFTGRVYAVAPRNTHRPNQWGRPHVWWVRRGVQQASPAPSGTRAAMPHPSPLPVPRSGGRNLPVGSAALGAVRPHVTYGGHSAHSRDS